MKKILCRIMALVCTCALLVTSVSALSVSDARALLEKNYIYELPEEAKSAKTLDELFSYVSDSYTYYMSQEEYAEFLSDVEHESSVTGIGASISYTDDGILLLSVLDGGGAADAGLTAGDLIVEIEGQSCVPATESHRAMLVGEAGTSVSFVVLHENGQRQSYTVERRVVPIANTSFTVKDGVGFIDCDSFGSETGQYFIDGITENDAAVHDWIVDLRSNSGGVASSAITALGAFVGNGTLLYYKNRAGNIYGNPYTNGYLTESPAIVLTSPYSASASEIFAGGIAGGNGGIVVGDRSFGKGVAQQVYDKSTNACFNGDALKVTVFRFYCLNGNTTDKIGVIPTLCVPAIHAESVAKLLCGTIPQDGSDFLHLVLGGYDFYVNLPSADREALYLLLSALAPDATVYYGSHGVEVSSSPEDARRICGYDPASREFTDVSQSEYADHINALAVYGILHGDGSSLFYPDRTMTRAEVCALLAQALDIGTDSEGYFNDVPSWRWFASPVNAMASLGLVKGVGDGRFDPYGTMTQQEFFIVMARLAEFLNLSAYRYMKTASVDKLSGDYSAFSSWAKISAGMLNEGIRIGNGESTSMLFTELENTSPRSPILRGEAAETMYRVLTTLDVLSY